MLGPPTPAGWQRWEALRSCDYVALPKRWHPFRMRIHSLALIRWYRSLWLAQPPANGYEPGGFRGREVFRQSAESGVEQEPPFLLGSIPGDGTRPTRSRTAFLGRLGCTGKRRPGKAVLRVRCGRAADCLPIIRYASFTAVVHDRLRVASARTFSRPGGPVAHARKEAEMGRKSVPDFSNKTPVTYPHRCSISRSIPRKTAPRFRTRAACSSRALSAGRDLGRR